MFDLNFYLNKCRFCWNELSTQGCVEIDDFIARQFEYITNKEFISSLKLSNILCTDCNTKIGSYFQYKQELITRQDKLTTLLEQAQESQLELSPEAHVTTDDYDQLDDAATTQSDDSPQIISVPSCQHCQKTFVDQKKLHAHIDRYHSKSHRKCEYCDFIANSKSELLKHVKLNHLKSNSTSDVRICPDCGKILKGNNHLNFHIKTKHLKMTKYQCDLCGFKCYGKYEIRSHILIHHLPLELRKEYKCDLCPSVLTTAMSLKTHKQHKHSGLKPHTCIFCNKSYALKETLKSHIRNVHNGERKYKCPTCNKGFNSNPRLTDHINNTHGHKQEIPCDKCGKVFNSLRNLQTHAIYHSAPTLKCSYCDKMFYIKKNLREHEESVHLGITYQCDVCQRSFQSTSGLRRHGKSHCKG